MMQCNDISELMMDYLYQELDGSQAEAFRSHLVGCNRCNAELEAFQRTRTAMRELPEAEPSQAVTARLLHEAAKRAPRPAQEEESGGLLSWFAGLFRPLVAHPGWAAAASLIMVLGVAGYLKLTGKVDERSQDNPAATAAAEERVESPRLPASEPTGGATVVTQPVDTPATLPPATSAQPGPEPAKPEARPNLVGDVLNVETDPAQAQVSIDGKLEEGRHAVQLKPAEPAGGESTRGARTITPEEESKLRGSTGTRDGYWIDDKDYGNVRSAPKGELDRRVDSNTDRPGRGAGGGGAVVAADPAPPAPAPAPPPPARTTTESRDATVTKEKAKPAKADRAENKPAAGGDRGAEDGADAEDEEAAHGSAEAVEEERAVREAREREARKKAEADKKKTGGQVVTTTATGSKAPARPQSPPARTQRYEQAPAASPEESYELPQVATDDDGDVYYGKKVKQSAPKRNDNDPQTLLQMAKNHAKAGNCDAALQTRAKIQKIDPDFYKRNVIKESVFDPCDKKLKRRQERQKKAPMPSTDEAPAQPSDYRDAQ
jgi:anti-sigma factor RsiW